MNQASRSTWTNIRFEADFDAQGVTIEQGASGFFTRIPAWGWMFEMAASPSSTVVDFDGESTSHAITDDEIKQFARLPSVRYVSIRQAAVTDEGLAHLRDLRFLADLNLSACQITGSGFRHLRESSELTSLDLSSLRSSDEGFSNLASLTQLRRLSLSNVAISDAAARELSRMTFLESL